MVDQKSEKDKKIESEIRNVLDKANSGEIDLNKEQRRILEMLVGEGQFKQPEGWKETKEKIIKAAEQVIRYEIESVYFQSKEGYHKEIYGIETPKRLYFFYFSNGKGTIIGNDLDKIDPFWQNKLGVDKEGKIIK